MWDSTITIMNDDGRPGNDRRLAPCVQRSEPAGWCQSSLTGPHKCVSPRTGPPRDDVAFYSNRFQRSTDTSTASVQVRSTLSPTFTLASASLSSTLEVYFQPLGPVKVIDGVFMSMLVIVAVMVRCLAFVAPGRSFTAGVLPLAALSTSASPGCFIRRTRFS